MNPQLPSFTSLEDEIADLERRLAAAKAQLPSQPTATIASTTAPTSLHALLLLSDSALPLGSFAFSSGLESYLAHHPSAPASSKLSSLHTFLRLSVSSAASTALPYVLACHRRPERIEELDNDYDASLVCNVARRASVAQGRGLLSVWERAFRGRYAAKEAVSQNGDAKGVLDGEGEQEVAAQALAAFSTRLRAASLQQSQMKSDSTGQAGADESDDEPPAVPPPSAHLPPLWGLITLLLGVGARESLYLFLFSHLRTVVSAAVRASVLGPYQAQALLASGWVQDLINGKLQEWWEKEGDGTEEAGQVVPVMDLWVGRHEMLYSRIFNS